jgi:AraC-like DNA-binding protein
MIESIIAASILFALVTAYLLLFRKYSHQLYSDALLAIFLLVYSFNIGAYLLIHFKWLIVVPFLYKTAAPISYLAPPLAYLYVRSVLRNEIKFKKIDLLHFLPFLLVAINYWPIYFMPYNEKMALIARVIDHPFGTLYEKEGILPAYFQFAKPLQCLIYFILQWRLLSHFEKDKFSASFSKQTKLVVKWIKVFNILISTTVFSFLIVVIVLFLGIGQKEANQDFAQISMLLLSFSILYLSSYLILNPQLLFGLPYVKNFDSQGIKNVEKAPQATLDYEKEAQLIRAYFEKEKPYLTAKLTIRDVSVALDIPLHELSFIINRYFELRFTDFVNSYRIKLVEEKIKSGYLNQYTQEALALETGFSSKHGFYDAFRKVHSCTPAEFAAKYVS